MTEDEEKGADDGDGPAAEIGRHIVLAGLALSQAAYLMDEHGPVKLSELRYKLAQRKVMRLLSETAHLASLLHVSAERSAHTSPASRMRIVRSVKDLPAVRVGTEGGEIVVRKKPLPSDVLVDELTWECSRLSAPHGLEIAELPGGSVALRDADDPAGPLLVASRWEWEAFAASVETADFRQFR